MIQNSVWIFGTSPFSSYKETNNTGRMKMREIKRLKKKKGGGGGGLEGVKLCLYWEVQGWWLSDCQPVVTWLPSSDFSTGGYVLPFSFFPSFHFPHFHSICMICAWLEKDKIAENVHIVLHDLIKEDIFFILLCVWILFKNAGGQLSFRFFSLLFFLSLSQEWMCECACGMGSTAQGFSDALIHSGS